MLHCNNCDVDISTKTNICPLCGGKLEGDGIGQVQTFPPLTTKKINKPKTFLMFFDIFCLLAIGTTLLVNLLTYSYVFWSMIVIIGYVFSRIYLVWALKYHKNWSGKLVYISFGLCALLLCIAIFSSKLDEIINLDWVITYVIPFIMCLFCLVGNCYVFNKKFASSFVVPQFFQCLLCIAYSVVGICAFSSAIYPFIMVLGIAFVSLVLICVNWNNFRNELTKDFHI